eukprot:gene21115-25353_t
MVQLRSELACRVMSIPLGSYGQMRAASMKGLVIVGPLMMIPVLDESGDEPVAFLSHTLKHVASRYLLGGFRKPKNSPCVPKVVELLRVAATALHFAFANVARGCAGLWDARRHAAQLGGSMWAA